MQRIVASTSEADTGTPTNISTMNSVIESSEIIARARRCLRRRGLIRDQLVE